MRVFVAVVLISMIAPALVLAQGNAPAGWQVQRDLAYGPHELHRLDAYLQPGPGLHSVVVFVHGGGHVGGDKTGGGLHLVLPIVARAGYSIVSINYRFAPQHRHPAQVDDARLAVRWLRANAARFRIDPRRLAVAGASAGGHTVTFLRFTSCPDNRAASDEVSRQSCRPQTVVNLFGTTDLRQRNDQLLLALLGPNPSAEVKAEASPITHISSEDPPTLSLHGTADFLVPYAQSVALHRALSAAGVSNRLVRVEGGGHGNDWNSLATAADWQRALVEWLDTYLMPEDLNSWMVEGTVPSCFGPGRAWRLENADDVYWHRQ